MRQIIVRAAWLLILMPLVLAACTAATPKAAEPDPPAPDPPPPSFHGSWQERGEWHDDGEVIGSVIHTLTFTKSRWIEYTEAYLFGDTEVADDWSDSGTWKADDEFITRIDSHDDDEDGVAENTMGVRKTYFWGEGRNRLCMQAWGHEHEFLDLDECTPYTRAAPPAPDHLIGTWESGAYEEDDGVIFSWEIVITADTFTMTVERDDRVFVLSGTYEIDSDEMFILVQLEDAFNRDGSLIDEPGSPWRTGNISRWAYARTSSSDSIVVSTHWTELTGNPVDPELGHADRLDAPHGIYWLRLTKQQ